MALDKKTLAAARNYVDLIADSLGAVKGAPCTIKSTAKVSDGTNITFEWTGTSGTTQTSTIKVMDGLSITGVNINLDNTITCTLSDNTTITTENSITTIDGFSPTIIENSSNTDEIYKLDITDENGITTTPNLKGSRGSDGHTPNFTIGTVTTLPAGSEATVSITGTSENPVLNIGIPKGADGDNALITTDEKVKMTSTDTDAKYLEELIDNSTIKLDVDNNVLYVSKIKDQTVSVAEINFLTGVTSNIQEQINNLGKSMSMYGVFDTKSDLLASTDPIPVDGNTAIVIADEDNDNKQMTYIYIESTSGWVQVAESSITIRDFTTNPINLSTETTGTLSEDKIDTAIARLSQVLDKETYGSSTEGVVNSSKTLDGLLYTIQELNDAISTSHEHLNMTALNNIIINGIGNRFLSDNGVYKELIVNSSSAPTDEYVFWLDTSDASNPILKIYDGTDWITISSNNGISSTVTGNVKWANVEDKPFKSLSTLGYFLVDNDGVLAIKDDYFLSKEKYVSTVNEEYVKNADSAKSIEELASTSQPNTYWGHDSNGIEGQYPFPLAIQGDSAIIKRVFTDVYPGFSQDINSTVDLDEKAIISVKKLVSETTDVDVPIQEFINSKEPSINHSPNVTLGKDYTCITTVHERKTVLNSDDFYEIDLTEFSSTIEGIEVNS